MRGEIREYDEAVAKLAAKTGFAHAVRALITAYGHDGTLTQMAAMTIEVMRDYKTEHGKDMPPPGDRRR